MYRNYQTIYLPVTILVCPGELIEIEPPKLQTNFALSSSAGIFEIFTFVALGVQGATVVGTHGIGVSTPIAAAVAAATVGLAID